MSAQRPLTAPENAGGQKHSKQTTEEKEREEADPDTRESDVCVWGHWGKKGGTGVNVHL